MFKKKDIKLILLFLIVGIFASYHIYYLIKNNNEYNLVLQEEDFPQYLVEKENLKVNNYLGILSIPKIKLEKKFYRLDSNENNVNKNIQLLKGSEMPNIKNSYLIIAAHSGNSYLGFFKNLAKLTLKDKIYIYYENTKYEYEINNIYEMDKNGKISFIKYSSDNYLVLTTCAKNNKQLVVTSKLVSK